MSGNRALGSWKPTRPRGPIGANFTSPGPKYSLPGSIGHREHDVRKIRGPAYSFGTRHKAFKTNGSPGPAYLIPSHVTRVGVDGTPKYSLHNRIRDLKSFKSPGPGAYSPEKSGKVVYVSTPSYSLSSRNRLLDNYKSPGPAAYALKPVIGRDTPSYSITGKSREVVYFDRKTPGPGTYSVVDPNSYKGKNPIYSMTGRNTLPSDSTRKPGPGAHSPENVVINRETPPSYTFGMRHSDYVAPLITDPLE